MKPFKFTIKSISMKKQIAKMNEGLQTALYAAGFLALMLFLSYLQWFA